MNLLDNEPVKVPSGELVIKTIAMPADTNAYGDIFGGWILSQMDLGGAVLASKIVKHRIATVAIDKMQFHRPVQIGDTVCCYASLFKQGRTSLTIHIETWSGRRDDGVERQVTEGMFTYVAIDETGCSTPINWAKANL